MNRRDLRRWRRKHGLTQLIAAEIAGVHRVTWAKWEVGTYAVPHWLPDVLERRYGSADHQPEHDTPSDPQQVARVGEK